MDRPRLDWRSRALHEVRALAAIGGLWVGSWLVLTLATWIAGGQPTAGLLSYADPVAVLHRIPPLRWSEWWALVDPTRQPSPPLFWGAIACILGSATAVAWWGHQHAFRRLSSSRVTTTSRWATAADLHGLRTGARTAGRFQLGRHHGRTVRTEPETSVLVIGPTRSGKTTSLVVPNLLAWHGPAVATSTKGELLTLTAGARQRRGPVYVYDPTGDAGAKVQRVTWSPITGCDDLDRAWRVAAWLCAGMHAAGRGDNDWLHWSESGKLLIAPLLFAAASTARTVVDVQEWVHAFDLATPSAIVDELMYEGHPDAARALTMIRSVDDRPEKERGTVFSTVMRIFSALNERAVAQSAMSSRFDPSVFLQNAGTLYLCSARQSPERVAGLFVGLLMTVVTEAYDMAERSPSGRLQPELGLFLDELANVVPIDDLPSLASQGAGRGVVCMSIVQDISQLRARYGADRTNSIVNNHPCKVVLPGLSDVETAEVLSRLVGSTRRTEMQLTYGRGESAGHTLTTRIEPLATADAIRQLAPHRALMLYRGRAPALLWLRPWYADRRMRRLTATRPVPGADYVGVLGSDASDAKGLHLVRNLFKRRLHHTSNRGVAHVVTQRDE